MMGADLTTYTKEELVFSALNHDLGKLGDEEHDSYIPQTDKWRTDKLGEDYMFNTKVPFASVPDRGLFLLQSHGISYTFNEMIAIQTHDGLYDKANDKRYTQYFRHNFTFNNLSAPILRKLIVQSWDMNYLLICLQSFVS